KIRNSKSGLYLAVAGGGTRNGTNVIQWRDVKQPDIRWRLQPAGRCYKIYNINSRKYLAVSGGSRFDGANVTIWEDTGKRTQRGIIWCLQ
ncbi:MAG: RICIN domain-containing protein, partial [Pseudomonadota bacterium]